MSLNVQKTTLIRNKSTIRKPLVKPTFNINADVNKKITYEDIVNSMLSGYNYEETMTNDTIKRPRIFETIYVLLVITKIIYSTGVVQIGNFSAGILSNLKDIRDILKQSICQGADKSDLTLLDKENVYPTSVKYWENISPDDTEIQKLLASQQYSSHKIIPTLVVKDKAQIINHSYRAGSKDVKKIHKDLENDGRILDENDIKIAYMKFQEKFKDMKKQDFIQYINTTILENNRKWLTTKLHQEMTKLSIVNEIINNGILKHIIGHKPRSGKSITTLLTIVELIIMKRIKKCLFMTSIPETIEDYIKEIRKYYDFEVLENSRILTKEGLSIEITLEYEGIIFGSIQFLKMDNKSTKSEWLKKYNPDMIVLDESHYGGSTKQTNKKIFKNLIKSVSKEMIVLYVSATSKKTQQFYGIYKLYEWTFVDESYMRNINDEEIKKKMEERHGKFFIKCLNNDSISKDYSECPVPILLRPEFPSKFKEAIDEYNRENNTELGFDIKSILSLEEKKRVKKGVKNFHERFKLESTPSGVNVLKWLFKWIISNDPNDITLMSNVLETQGYYKSRQSSSEDPLVHIMFLPKVGSIVLLQKCIQNFIKKYKLWSNFNVVSSNCKSKTDEMNQLSLTRFVDKQLEITKTNKLDGLIVLLGDQGSMGVTFKKCDTLFMLDNSLNMEYYFQRIMRCMTEDKHKKIGCIVDLHFQRTFNFIKNMCKMIGGKDQSIQDSLYKLINLNIFHFNPKDYNFTNVNSSDITRVCSSISETIMKSLKEDTILSDCFGIKCEELDNLLKEKCASGANIEGPNYSDIKDLTGLNQDIKKAGKAHHHLLDDTSSKNSDDTPDDVDITEKYSDDEDTEDEEEDHDKQKQTKSGIFFRKCLCLLSLLTRLNKNNTLKTMFESLTPKQLKIFNIIISIDLINKDIIVILENDLKINTELYNCLMNSLFKISDDYSHIVEDIKNIYSNAQGPELRDLVEKHFKPSKEEEKENAEIPTPRKLVDEMDSTPPKEFFMTPQKVVDLCCGKGTFQLDLFDKFWVGLSNLIPDEYERCKIIMTECIYFADKNETNVLITHILLECHVQSYCAISPDYQFNYYVGNSLELDIKKEWNVEYFDLVIGNPPYETRDENGKTKGGTNLYSQFINYAINIIKENGYLLYITPISWLSPSTNSQSGGDLLHNVFLKYDLLILNLNECKKHFNKGSTFSYYLIQKSITKCITRVRSEYKKQIIDSEIDFKEYKNMPFLPIHITADTIKLVNGVINNSNDKLKISRARTLDTSNKSGKNHLQKNKTDTFQYITYHTSETTFYSDIKQPNYEKFRILLNMSGYLKPTIVKQCNTTESKFYIEYDDIELLNKIVIMLNSEDIKNYLELCKYSGFNSRIVLEHISL